MNRLIQSSFVAIVFATAGAGASAAPVTYFTSAYYDNSLFRTGQPGATEETAGNASAAGGDSTARFAASDADGSRSDFASASLSSGQLKGATATTGSVARNGSTVSSVALIGDSFRTFSGASPFDWAGRTASFSFLVDGSEGRSGSNADTYAYLSLFILAPGALDGSLIADNNHYAIYADSPFRSALIAQFSYGLTPESTTNLDYGDPNFGFRPVDQVIDPTHPIRVTAAFAPGGDFDWILMLITASDLSAAGPSDFAFVDLAHTITANYNAPSGTTTYSASGLFPGTVPLVAQVPEPSELPLLLIGAAGLAIGRDGRQRRRHRSRFAPVFAASRADRASPARARSNQGSASSHE